VEGEGKFKWVGLVVWIVLPSAALVSTPSPGSRYHLVLLLCVTVYGFDNRAVGATDQSCDVYSCQSGGCLSGCCVVIVISCV
jgi:hypothetical protein